MQEFGIIISHRFIILEKLREKQETLKITQIKKVKFDNAKISTEDSKK
jgi:hypothetical protein